MLRAGRLNLEGRKSSAQQGSPSSSLSPRPGFLLYRGETPFYGIIWDFSFNKIA